jgi:glutamate synthase (NADPH/NADH) small chain
MAKPTGFLEYQRQELALRPVQERIKDWQEIKLPGAGQQEALKKQAARCMNCGVPFCHSGISEGRNFIGCPLQNLMPEFNDFVYQGLDDFAYARLSLTNNFPEFTSHVCPALCEGACCASVYTDPVTIKNIEQYIIETAFAKGLVKPQLPEKRTGKKVAVIGSGPSGLACADQLNRAGHLVTVYERADRPGGLLMYGIPNMKLDKGLVYRRIELLQAAGIKFQLNCEIGQQMAADTLLKEYDAVVLCTGSTVPRDLQLPGRELKGIYFAKEYLEQATRKLLSSKAAGPEAKEEAVGKTTAPSNQKQLTTQAALPDALDAQGKDVVVIGGGDTGTDCVATAIRQGCRSVRQLEIMPCLPASRTEADPWPLFPRIFKTDYGQEEAFALYQKDPREFCVNSQAFLGRDGQLEQLRYVQIKWEAKNGRRVPVEIPGTTKEVPCQLVLLALGFTGSENRLLNEFKLTRSRFGTIAADENSYAASVPGIFAAGDARRGQSLVVWAIKEGRSAAAAVDKYLSAVN